MRPGAGRLAPDHRPPGRTARRRDREARLVWHALEDRALPQDPEIGVPGRGLAAADRRTPRETDRRSVHTQLVVVLDDDDEPRRSERFAVAGAHRERDPGARPRCPPRGPGAGCRSDAVDLPRANRAPW